MSVNTAPALVWGAGAIGSIVGAALLDAGRPVVFVDTDERQLDKIRSGDLVIDGVGGKRSYRAPAFAPGDAIGDFTLAFLCVRLNHNSQAIPAMAQHLSAGATVVACQNGFGAWDVAAALGPADTVVASFFLPANLREPGRVTYGSRADISLGCVEPGESPALDRAFEQLGAIDVDVHKVHDIRAVIWSKLCYGALLAAAALDDGMIAEFLANPRFRPIVLGIVREMTDIASATGHPAQDLDWFQPARIASRDVSVSELGIETTLARLRKSAKPVSGYWTQIVTHGRRTELELMFGPVLRDAERVGSRVPVLRMLMQLVADMEARRRTNGPELLELLLTTATSR